MRINSQMIIDLLLLAILLIHTAKIEGLEKDYKSMSGLIWSIQGHIAHMIDILDEQRRREKEQGKGADDTADVS